jgi:hypothetical protein
MNITFLFTGLLMIADYDDRRREDADRRVDAAHPAQPFRPPVHAKAHNGLANDGRRDRIDHNGPEPPGPGVRDVAKRRVQS